MSPRVTLQQITESMRSQPTTPDQELALVEFLDLTDSEQKGLIFTALVHYGAQLDYLMNLSRR